MTQPLPRICCLDLDTFFVSVERLLDPSLVGRPVVVGGARGARGVVTSASYEVRRSGVRSGMPLTRATQLAPEAIFVPGHRDRYADYAARVRAVAASYTPRSRIASIDEMYLDFRGCEGVYRRAGDRDDDHTIERVVREITARINDEIGLPSSCGIASSAVVAKVATGLAKPAGVRLVPAGAERAFLAPLPVRRLPGVGPVAEKKLHAAGLRTLGDIATTSEARLREVLGSWGPVVRAHASGQGSTGWGRDRPHFTEHDPEDETAGSLSNERTFARDLTDGSRIEAQLGALTERVCWRARARGVRAGGVGLKVRFASFETVTRSRAVQPTNDEAEVQACVVELFRNLRRARRAPIRLVGVKLDRLQPHDRQLDLFETKAGLHRAVDAVRTKFGFESLRSASSLRPRSRDGELPPGRERARSAMGPQGRRSTRSGSPSHGADEGPGSSRRPDSSRRPG